MISQLKVRLEQKYRSFIALHRSKAEAYYDRRNLSHYLKSSIPLSAEEKATIKQKWGGGN